MIRGFLVLLALLLLPAVALAAPAADRPTATVAAKPKCFGKTATIVGTRKSDKGRRKVLGTKKADVIVTMGGADDVRGRGGNDRICAGSGKDRVDGGGGKDLIDGGGGNDKLKGGGGADAIAGGPGNDKLDGGRGTDLCNGGKGKNTLKRCEPLPLTDPQGPGGGPGGPSGPGGPAAPSGPTGPSGLTQAAPDSATTSEDESTTIPVLANDTGNGLTITSLDAGETKAALEISGGSVIYDPSGRLDAIAGGESTTETFTYTVTAGSGATATGTVTVTVIGVDDAAVAVDDAATADEGTPTDIDVLANDTDIDGGPKKVGSVDTFGSSGTVTIATDGSMVTYTPGIGVCGTTDTFKYTLDTGGTATVTVTIACSGTPPTAVNDSATVLEDSGKNPLDVLANDSDPDGGAKGVVSATQPANGTVEVAGDASGLTYEPDAGYCNDPPGGAPDTFTYTVNGGSTATVSVTVTCTNDPPVAVDDAKTLEEDAPATAIDVLANDTDSDGGPKSIEAVTQGANGAVVITGGGTGLTYEPGADHCGADSFTYTLDGGSTATVSITVTCVNDAPVGVADSFSGGIQGVRMRVGTTHADTHETEHTGNVLANDTDVDTPRENLQVTPGVITTTDGGTVTMASDGSFTYDPPAGDDGEDTFTYVVHDDEAADATGTVTLSRAGPRVWFVDDSAPPGGRGVSHAPLQSLAPLNTGGAQDAQDATGDRIFVHAGAYTSGIALEADQKLLGQPHGLNVNSVQLVAAGGTKPAMSSAGANVVIMAPGTEVQDVALGNTAAGGYSLHAPAGAGSFLVGDTDIDNTVAGALNLADGSPVVSLGSVSSNNSSGNAVRITDTDAGSVSIAGGTLQNAANADVHVANAASSLSLGSNISDDLGQLISISGGTGANTFNGSVTDLANGTGNGISIDAAAGATSFTNTVTLSTGGNEAFVAANSGTLTMTGPASTIDAAGGALRIVNTSIAEPGVTFRSIRSVGGSRPGIHLHGTGSSGGLIVAGTGTAGSGGTISGKTGADGSTNGIAVLLNSARNVQLNRMQLNDLQNFGIRGTAVSNFSLLDSVISGVSGTNPDVNEAAIYFENLYGTSQIARTPISGGASDNVRVINRGGTASANRLTFDAVTIGLNQSTGNDGILLEALDTASLNATIKNSTFLGSRGDHIDMTTQNDSVGDVVVEGNTLSNAHANSLGGSINADAGGSSDLTYLIENNTINGAKGTAIFAGKQFGGSPGNGTAVGTISNNRVGTSGVASSGSLDGSGIEASALARGKHSVVISNNVVRQYRDNGISLFVGGSSTSTTGLPAHDATVNFTVTGNTVTQPGPNGAFAGGGVFLNAGTNSPDAYQVCLNMQNNQLAGSAPLNNAASRDVWLRQRFGSVVRLPGYTGPEHNGSGNLADALKAYLVARGNTINTLNASAQDTTDGGGGFYNTAGSAPCLTT